MNFLKISGLVISAGSVAGGAGAGIYYGVNSKNANQEKIDSKVNKKTQFHGKLVFIKKSLDDSDLKYETKLLTTSDYNEAVTEFNKNKDNSKKHEKINKWIEISHLLDIQETKDKLNKIFGSEITLTDAKTKISSESEEFKKIFNEEIYKKLEDILKNIN